MELFPMTEELFKAVGSNAGVLDAMETMAGFDRSHITQRPVPAHGLAGDIFIELELVEWIKGRAVFAFSKELALNLVQIMTMMDLDEVNELVISALCELTNSAAMPSPPCPSAALPVTSTPQRPPHRQWDHQLTYRHRF